MTYEQEQLKAAEQQCCSGAIGSNLYGQAQSASEPYEGLRSRIYSQRRRAEAEGARANQLIELEYLLDKHPEVARILELMEQVGKY